MAIFIPDWSKMASFVSNGSAVQQRKQEKLNQRVRLSNPDAPTCVAAVCNNLATRIFTHKGQAYRFCERHYREALSNQKLERIKKFINSK